MKLLLNGGMNFMLHLGSKVYNITVLLPKVIISLSCSPIFYWSPLYSVCPFKGIAFVLFSVQFGSGLMYSQFVSKSLERMVRGKYSIFKPCTCKSHEFSTLSVSGCYILLGIHYTVCQVRSDLWNAGSHNYVSKFFVAYWKKQC